MANFLSEMAKASRVRADALPLRVPESRLDRPRCALSLGRFDLIAEIKQRSPAEGRLADAQADRVSRALAYADAGAAAISVLTEPQRFDGSLAHLDEVAGATAEAGVPVMRKDFLIDVRQLAEARAHGASGVLLIAAMLDDDGLRAMLDCAFEIGLFVLLESFGDDDFERSLGLLDRSRYADRAAAKELLLGINTRDLRSLEVDSRRLDRFAKRLPDGAATVAESGLRTAEDTARVAALGYRLGLVGTALMRSDDPSALVAGMLASARQAR